MIVISIIVNCARILSNILIAPVIIAFIMPSGFQLRYGRTAAAYQKRYCRFIPASFIIVKIFAIIYYYICAKCMDHFLVSTGLLLTLFLIVSGLMINKLYNKALPNHNFRTKLDQGFVDKTFIIGSTTLICAADFFVYDRNISWLLISVALGKYFWIDFGLIPYRNMRQKISDDLSNVSLSAKRISVIFACLLLLSDILAFFADKYIFHLGVFFWSTLLTPGFCCLYLAVCSIHRF